MDCPCAFEGVGICELMSENSGKTDLQLLKVTQTLSLAKVVTKEKTAEEETMTFLQ